MFPKIIFIIISVVFAAIAYNNINDTVFVIISAAQFTLGAYLFLFALNVHFSAQKVFGVVHSKKRKGSEIPGQISRTFVYTFMVDSVEYKMQKTISMGGVHEYQIGEGVVLYIFDHRNKKVVPRQLLMIYFFLSCVFIALSIAMVL